MPSDDLVLSVRQISGYSPVTTAPTTAAILMQTAGLGSAYASISPADLVSTALAQGGDLVVGGGLLAQSVQGGRAQFSSGAVNLFSAQKACVVELDATWATIAGAPIATQAFASGLVAGLQASTVWSFNGRRGDVCLWIQDILAAGGAPQFSPVFGGEPRAPTPSPWSCNSRIATTAFVQRNFIDGANHLLADHPFVFTFNGRTGDIVLTAQDIIDAGGSGEIFDSPAFTGVPTAPTAPSGTDTTQVATTAFVQAAITNLPYAPLNSPSFTGYVSGPTPPPGSSTGQLATTAFVMNAVAESTAGVASFNTRTGIVTLEATDITGAGGALLSSPALTGVPTAPTAAPGSNSTTLATTAFVQNAIAGVIGGVTSFNTRTGAVILTSADLSAAGGALLASPALTGTPTAPTASFGNSSQQIATTAFVDAAILNGAVESFNGRTGTVTLTAADISAAGGAALQSPAFLGTPTAPTATLGSNSTQLATTAFVQAAIGAGAGVTSFNTRTGPVTLTLADVTGVGGAPLTSPALTGVPTAPTASVGTSSTQLATTAFVAAALAGGAGVSSFNTRTGAVTLLGTDISGAGGALLSSPSLTGTPTAPTQTIGNSSTALATTAFVQNAIATGSVASFNGRVGAITLIAADISAAGGALTASPALTGVPTAPTATAGTNTNQLATTQFVETALAAAGGVNSFNGRAGAVTLTNADVIAVLPASTTTPIMDGTAAVGTANAWSRGDHVHPSDTSRLALSGGTMTGAIVLPTTAASGNQAIRYNQVNTLLAGYLPLAGGTLTGTLTAPNLVATASLNGPQWFLSMSGTANYWVYDGSNQMMWINNAGAQWIMRWTPDNLTFNNVGPVGGIGAYENLCDARSKRGIAPETRGLATILKLMPKLFTRTTMGASQEIGFIADEVQPVLPEAVKVMGAVLADGSGGLDSPNPTLGLCDTFIIPILVNAVKELTSRLETLEAARTA